MCVGCGALDSVSARGSNVGKEMFKRVFLDQQNFREVIQVCRNKISFKRVFYLEENTRVFSLGLNCGTSPTYYRVGSAAHLNLTSESAQLHCA